MSKKGGGPQDAPGQEATVIVAVIVIGIVCWLVWTQGRPVLIYPLFGMAWLEYQGLDRLGLLDPEGRQWLAYVTTALDGRRDHFSIGWSDLVDMLGDIGSRCALWLALLTGVLGSVAALRMRGDGLRRQFSLTGKAQDTVYRMFGWKGAHGFVAFLAGTPKFLPTYWLFKLMVAVRLVKARKEWVQRGVSFAHYQAQHWKVALAGAE
jgi:hypothetical protein